MGRSKMQINKWWQKSQWNAQGSYGWKEDKEESTFNIALTSVELDHLQFQQYLATLTPPTIGQDSALEAGLEQ